MKKVLLQISELLGSDFRRGKFTIVGYGFIDVIVEIAYDDCYQYFIAKYDDDGNYHDLEAIGYSEDHENLGTPKEWMEIYKRIDESQSKIKK